MERRTFLQATLAAISSCFFLGRISVAAPVPTLCSLPRVKFRSWSSEPYGYEIDPEWAFNLIWRDTREVFFREVPCVKVWLDPQYCINGVLMRDGEIGLHWIYGEVDLADVTINKTRRLVLFPTEKSVGVRMSY